MVGAYVRTLIVEPIEDPVPAPELEPERGGHPMPDADEPPMTHAAERWRKLTAEAFAREGHRCQLALDRCIGSVSTVVVVREPGERLEPATLEQLVSACRACSERRHPEPTAEQLLAEELEGVADESLILHVDRPGDS
jgi:hypothetical protein